MPVDDQPSVTAAVTKRPRGRPVVPADKRAASMSISFPNNLASALRDITHHTHVPNSALVQEAVRLFILDRKALHRFVTEYRMKRM